MASRARDVLRVWDRIAEAILSQFADNIAQLPQCEKLDYYSPGNCEKPGGYRLVWRMLCLYENKIATGYPLLSEPYIAQQEYFVRYAETDAMGLVHHSSYVIYLEEARSHYSRERGYSYHQMEASGRFVLITDLQVRYAAPARYGDKIRVRCWLDSMKSRQFVFAYEVQNAETNAKLVTARTVHLCVDADGNLILLPPELRAWQP